MLIMYISLGLITSILSFIGGIKLNDILGKRYIFTCMIIVWIWPIPIICILIRQIWPNTVPWFYNTINRMEEYESKLFGKDIPLDFWSDKK